MSRKTVNVGLVGLALVVALAAVPSAEAGAFSGGERPSGIWNQVWAWAVSAWSGEDAAAAPALLTSIWAKAGWHIDPNGGVDPFGEEILPIDPDGNALGTIDPGLR